ncbi:type VI secretion system lipoprotein TssJ [Halopseudomonas pelagia]|uniref:type VI secretion system lipoprotein TssJ n=1 Tax=Halopseudomonas pelagia TaxID=553151 RepID=UPI0003A7384D|nr:type VI secretion system lipoprotein TssJ [Halopseudomonas pelagia]
MCKTLFLALTASLFVLVGCSTVSPYSDLTKLDLNLEGSSQLNPDLNDRPSPIVLHLMELKHPVAFENADFFSLYQRPREALSPDLIAIEELELRPGERRELKLSVQEGSRYVAVLAAYRNLPDTNWRFIIPLQEKGLNQINLRLDAEGIHELDSATKDRN